MKIRKNARVIQLLGAETTKESFHLFPASTFVLPLVIAILFGLFFYTSYLQVTAGAENLYLAESNLSWDGKVPAIRGLFYDINGEKLVVNESTYSIWTTIKTSYLENDEVCSSLEKLLTTSMSDCYGKDLSKKMRLAGGIDQGVSLLIADDLSLLGLDLRMETSRVYLYPKSFAQVIGYTGFPSDEEISSNIEADTLIGKYRLESTLDDQLRGTDGLIYGSGIEEQLIESIPGNNVVLTLDKRWQNSLYGLLNRQVNSMNADGGAAVIMDVDTGAIKAYASVPSFDPNLFSRGISSSEYEGLLNDKKKPLVDKVIGLQLAPGSTFKLATSYALLQSGSLVPSKTYFSSGCMQLGNYPFCEYGKYYLGSLDIKLALTRSSNIFFCNGVVDFEKQRSFADYQSLVSQLGFGQKTGIDLDGELKGLLPGPEYKLTNYQDQWYSGDSCNTAIGQGMVLATPIQMVNLVSLLANNGTLYRPFVVDRIVNQNGQVVKQTSPEVIRKVEISEVTRDSILSGMSGVVNNPLGTAYRFMHGLPGDIHAKTGSAETATMEDGKIRTGVHGWAVGYFTFGGKTYSFAAVLVFGGGAWNATPVMADFISCVFDDFAYGCL